MDLVTLSGGLGNQMFQFAFYLALKRRGKRVFLYKNKLAAGEHNGYELQRLFGIEDRETGGMWMTRLLQTPCAGKLVKHLLFPRKVKERTYYDYSAYAPMLGRWGVHWVGYWQSERYFADVRDEVLRIYRSPRVALSVRTQALLDRLRSQTAVSVHVRRGDYCLPVNASFYGGICTTDYYERAFCYLRARHPNAMFYVFSDDLAWVRENIPHARDMIAVDWNRGPDSWQDMLLMSHCSHNVLANSSFSWWGAYLNANPAKEVITPTRWAACPSPDAIPDRWIRL